MTVLAWHHSGLPANTAAAAKVLDNEIKEQWASRPLAHLTYIIDSHYSPISILPRNVVL